MITILSNARKARFLMESQLPAAELIKNIINS